MNAKRVGIELISGAAISFLAAAMFVRSPGLWPLMPKWIYGAVGLLFTAHTQEEDNSFEFLAAWLFCFLLLVVVAAAAKGILRWRRRPL